MAVLTHSVIQDDKLPWAEEGEWETFYVSSRREMTEEEALEAHIEDYFWGL